MLETTKLSVRNYKYMLSINHYTSLIQSYLLRFDCFCRFFFVGSNDIFSVSYKVGPYYQLYVELWGP